MLDESIICPTSIDTFLAKTPVKPVGSEKIRKTVKELREIKEELMGCLDENLEMPENFWDDEEKQEKKLLP